MLDHDKNILNEDELAGVSGGAGKSGNITSTVGNVPTERHYCKHCDKDMDFYVYSGSRPICSKCGNAYILGGM